MDRDVARAVTRLREVFDRYPRRPVLEGCPHCRGGVPVDEEHLFGLSIGLGGTIGTTDDVKALLPLLLERLVTGHELFPGTVFALLAREGLGDWPAAEREAVEGWLMAVWRSLLTGFPARAGAFGDAADFLADVARLVDPSPFLDTWDGLSGPEADRHLAGLVAAWARGARLPAEALAWLGRDRVRERLFAAFERDHAAAWADDLAAAYDLLAFGPQP
ncbi:hypothetical protein ACWGH8_12750 [Nonomuraea muscovyensis]|uniref:Uncharacterized protein n=1 Tax=Nonomuraea muscovyensis TaxID=1124761 RepID=A0A7X0CB34_9ACTN|nr:hypothetical protein [Nonomuraea muscovyensis]MBB6350456.1 hypothetical protein [Nonomuraea muscovyensis]